MPEPSIAELILTGDGKTARYRLAHAPCGIGRSDTNTVVLNADKVSRNHALVRLNDAGGYIVSDLGSRNGTLINGRRLVAPMLLQNGDVLQIGPFRIEYVGPSAEPASLAAIDHEAFPETAVVLAPREITVLVIDIRDFTGLARSLGETRTGQLMGTFNRGAGAILENLNCWAVKYIGDAVMAVWDHAGQNPVAVLRDALRAVVEIQPLIEAAQRQFELEQPLSFGVGINTGVASIGNLGSGASADYTALGDVVNKAFRLESITRTLQADLAFGNEVKGKLGSEVVEGLTTLQLAQLKGYAESCPVYTMRIGNLPALLSRIDAISLTK